VVKWIEYGTLKRLVLGSIPRCAPFWAVAGSSLFGGIFCLFPESKNLDTASISGRAVEAVVVIEMGLVMPDGLPVMDMDNIVFKSLFGFCFWVLFLGFVFGFCVPGNRNWVPTFQEMIS